MTKPSERDMETSLYKMTITKDGKEIFSMNPQIMGMKDDWDLITISMYVKDLKDGMDIADIKIFNHPAKTRKWWIWWR